MRYVYIVRCSDDTLYTGIAKDLDNRIYDHNNSKIGAKYTKSRRPVFLVWHKKTINRITASREEFRIKHMGKQKKELLVSSLKSNKKYTKST
ncbi:MAG TPA: GIY-YIG nuclease family protein [Candidatus Absconditabacterales bacterium]|nr:GIY-YIG nuclease family protein [Candidatus Absconditabacterales bacterium]